MGLSLEKSGIGQFQGLIDRIFDILPVPPENRAAPVEGHFHEIGSDKRTECAAWEVSR